MATTFMRLGPYLGSVEGRGQPLDPVVRQMQEEAARKAAHIRALEEELADYQRRLDAAKAAKDKDEIARWRARLASVEESLEWAEVEQASAIP